jgi:uncharacterized SAM-binding protein YcdF (DUF218 family)
MLVISKVLTTLVLPPGCIILGLIGIILFTPRQFKFVLMVITVLLYLFSIQPVADVLLRPLEDAYPPLLTDTPIPNSGTGHEPEAIVVLGGGIILGSPEAGAGQDTLSPDAVKRAVYAFSLRDVFSTPYIFSGGKVFDYGQDAEAITAGRLFVALGLPPERLIRETESRNTWENAREVAKLGYKQVILVTSAYHIARSVFCFEKNGIAVIPAPSDYKCDRGRAYDVFSFLPNMQFLYETSLALHEYIGLLYYRLVYH